MTRAQGAAADDLVGRVRRHLLAMADAAIRAVDAGALLDAALARPPAGFAIDRPTMLIAAGKAAASMAMAYVRAAGAACTRGLVSATHRTGPLPPQLAWFRGGHPVPSETSLAAGLEALRLAAHAPPGSQLVVLLSGGASSLLAAPQPGVSLEDKQRTTAALLLSGAEIHELNCVRKHLSAVKGGRLAAASPVPTFTFAVSDVVGPVEDDPSVIGSGPTVADPTTYHEALRVLARLPQRAVPVGVRDVLERGARGEIEESPKPGDPRLHGAYTIVGSRRSAMAAVRREAEGYGYRVLVRDAAVTGAARDAGSRLVDEALQSARPGEPTCLIASGETVVTVTGNGRGGRNQELTLGALAAVSDAARPVFFASVASDGVDGPTDAAGAWIGPDTRLRATAAGLDALCTLDNNDSYEFFRRLNDHIRTGRTDTNVGDLQIVIVL